MHESRFHSRREFLAGTAALLPLALAPDSVAAGPAPIRRAGGAFLKTSLNAYSFSDLLLANQKDPRQGLDLFRLCDYCAEQGFEAIDPTGYFFRGYPAAPDDAYLHAFKRHAFDRGLAISGTGVRNDFTAADPAVRREGVQRVKEWVVVAAKLGAPVLRVFVDCQQPFKTWQAASGNAPRERVEDWIVAAVRECAEHAAGHGVIIGLQNHGDFVATGAQHLRLLERVDHPWVGAIVDTGKYVTEDPYADIALLTPHAVNWQVKESPWGRADKPPTDLRRLVGIIRRGGYRGYLPIETLSAGRKAYDPYVLVARFHADLRAAIAATA